MNDHYDDKVETVDEETNNEIDQDDEEINVDNKTIIEEDDNEEGEQEKWDYKAKFMLDWVNTFRGYTVSILVLLLALVR